MRNSVKRIASYEGKNQPPRLDLNSILLGEGLVETEDKDKKKFEEKRDVETPCFNSDGGDEDTIEEYGFAEY